MYAMKQLQQELLDEAKSKMQTPEGAESLTDGEIEELANIISVTIVGGAWAAMDEFGTGSLMDESNPALSIYKGSDLWNPARADNKIRTRPAGPYTDIFGNQKIGRAPIAGVDLEAIGAYSPTPPSHAIRDATRWMKNFKMQKTIKNTLALFPFGKYIITNLK